MNSRRRTLEAKVTQMKAWTTFLVLHSGLRPRAGVRDHRLTISQRHHVTPRAFWFTSAAKNVPSHATTLHVLREIVGSRESPRDRITCLLGRPRCTWASRESSQHRVVRSGARGCRSSLTRYSMSYEDQLAAARRKVQRREPRDHRGITIDGFD